MTNGQSAGGQRIRSLTTRGMMVPLKFTLGTSAAIVRAVPLLLVDLLNEDGITAGPMRFATGRQVRLPYHRICRKRSICLKGKCVTPFDVAQILSRQFALAWGGGSVRMALSPAGHGDVGRDGTEHGVPLSRCSDPARAAFGL